MASWLSNLKEWLMVPHNLTKLVAILATGICIISGCWLTITEYNMSSNFKSAFKDSDNKTGDGIGSIVNNALAYQLQQATVLDDGLLHDFCQSSTSSGNWNVKDCLGAKGNTTTQPGFYTLDCSKDSNCTADFWYPQDGTDTVAMDFNNASKTCECNAYGEVTLVGTTFFFNNAVFKDDDGKEVTMKKATRQYIEDELIVYSDIDVEWYHAGRHPGSLFTALRSYPPAVHLKLPNGTNWTPRTSGVRDAFARLQEHGHNIYEGYHTLNLQKDIALFLVIASAFGPFFLFLYTAYGRGKTSLLNSPLFHWLFTVVYFFALSFTIIGFTNTLGNHHHTDLYNDVQAFLWETCGDSPNQITCETAANWDGDKLIDTTGDKTGDEALSNSFVLLAHLWWIYAMAFFVNMAAHMSVAYGPALQAEAEALKRVTGSQAKAPKVSGKAVQYLPLVSVARA